MTMVVTQMVPSANQPHLKSTTGTTLALLNMGIGDASNIHIAQKTKHMLPLSPHFKMIIFTLPLNDFGHGMYLTE